LRLHIFEDEVEAEVAAQNRAWRPAVLVAAALTLTACEGGATDATDATDAVKDERNAAGKGERNAAGEMQADSLRLFRGASSVQVTTRSAVAMGAPVEISVDRERNCRVVARSEVFRVLVERGGRTWMTWREDLVRLGTATEENAELRGELLGKWLRLSHDGRIRKSMVDLCALTPLRDLTDQMARPGSRTVREADVTEQGERLVPLRQGERGNSATAYVKAYGEPYLRKLVVDLAASVPESVDFEFHAYGEPVVVEPPKTSETVSSARIEALAERDLAAGLPEKP
jgi:hypothetical protein